MLLNEVSRYHVAAAAVRGGARVNEAVANVAHEMQSYFMHLAEKGKQFAFENGRGVLNSFDWSIRETDVLFALKIQTVRMMSLCSNQ